MARPSLEGVTFLLYIRIRSLSIVVVFLPAAGNRWNDNLNNAGSNGNYWSSSLSTDRSYLAWYLGFNSGNRYMDDNYRGSGRSVRAVCP